MTDVARQELAPRGIQVAALHVGYMDTDTAAHITAPKADPADVAALALDGNENDLTEILADDLSPTSSRAFIDFEKSIERKERPMSSTDTSNGTPISGAVALVTGGNRGSAAHSSTNCSNAEPPRCTPPRAQRNRNATTTGSFD